MKIIAVIPAYNEEKTIESVIRGVKKYVDEVIVVDDCSSDYTKAIAMITGASTYRHTVNKGVGASTRTGFNMALQNDCDVVLTIDGDGQHNPDEIPELLKYIQNSHVDVVVGSQLVIGSRFLEHKQSSLGNGLCVINKIPKYRKFGIDVINWLFNIFGSQITTDSQSCFRAYRKEVIESCPIIENGFGFSTEILIKARKKRFKLKDVPISCIYYEDYKQNSTLNPLRHGLAVALCTIKWRLRLHDWK